MEKTFRYIDENQDRLIEELFVLLRQKSISTIDDGVQDCARLLAANMEKSGIKTTIYQTPRHPIVYGEILVDENAPTMMVYGHYDVQPPEPLDQWDSDPFQPEIRGGRIYGRGTSDNKSQLFAHVKGVEAYLQTHDKLPINIKYLFEGEEEIGSPSLDAFAEEHRELLKSDVAIFSDSHIHESGKPQIILGLKGLCYVEVTLHGANRDIHSMKASTVPNPMWRMLGLLDSLKDGEKGLIKIDNFYENVRPLLELEIEAVNKIPLDEQGIFEDLGITKLVENRTGSHYYYNLIFEPTCNICGIYGGYTGEGSKTIIPNKVTAKIDMRLVPDQRPEEIYEKFKAHLVNHGYGDAEVKHFGMITPSRTPIDNPYVKVVEDAITTAWGEAPIVFPGIGGAGPNYVFTDILGIPCVLAPFANHDQNNHAPNENMFVEGYFNGIKTSAAIIDEMAKTRK